MFSLRDFFKDRELYHVGPDLQVDLDEKVEEIKLMQDYIHYVPPSKPQV